MLQGILSFAVLIVASAATVSPARADAGTSAPACSMLANIVYERVLGHGLHARAAAEVGTQATDLECENAVPVISKAFTAAMRDMNVHLAWKSPARTRGDLCLGADLSQCYPDQSPYVPYLRKDRAFVTDAWSAVQSAVAATSRTCPRPGTRVRFSPADLRRQLDIALDARVRVGGQQAYELR